MTRTLFISFNVLLVVLLGKPAWSDTKVKGKYTSMGQTSESVVLTKGLRQRFEFGTEMAVIEQSEPQTDDSAQQPDKDLSDSATWQEGASSTRHSFNKFFP